MLALQLEFRPRDKPIAFFNPLWAPSTLRYPASNSSIRVTREYFVEVSGARCVEAGGEFSGEEFAKGTGNGVRIWWFHGLF